MILTEYRLTLPMTLDEYRIGQLYTVAQASKQETGGGEGIEILKNEPFSNYPLFSVPQTPRRGHRGGAAASASFVKCECSKTGKTHASHGQNTGREVVPGASGTSANPTTTKDNTLIFKFVSIPWRSRGAGAEPLRLGADPPGVGWRDDRPATASIGSVDEPFSSGQYTYKIYHKESKVPAFVRLLAPKNSLELHEESWNSYPYCRTEFSNPYMKDAFKLRVESFHVADAGDSHNVHALPPEKLRQREVVYIDIANDAVPPDEYRPEYDPAKFRSVKTGRGPLGPNWRAKASPVMTCYKLVTAEFKWFGLQTKVENSICSTQKKLFNVFHRQIFCTIDEWFGMTLAQIRELEIETQRELDQLRERGELRGLMGSQ